MKFLIAIALIVLGVGGLAYGGISVTHQKKDVDIGPIQISHDKTDSLPIPPIAGGLCLVAGVVLLVTGGRGRAT